MRPVGPAYTIPVAHARKRHTGASGTPLGARLMAAADFAGLTITRIERMMVAVGLATQGYLSKVKRGDIGKNAISNEKLKFIAKTTGVRYVWLATGDGPMVESSVAVYPTDECPNRADALGRLEGLLSPQVIEALLVFPIGPEGDLPVTEWMRIALAEQLRHNQWRLLDGPRTPPPKGSETRKI